MTAKPDQRPGNGQQKSNREAPAPMNEPVARDSTTQSQNPNDNSPPWYAAFKRPEGWGIIVALLTLLAIWYQAEKTAVATQASQEALEAIKVQTGVMQESVRAAKSSADAAIDSAKAAQDNVRLVVSKERARLSVPISTVSDPKVGGNFLLVKYEVVAICPTPAIIIDSIINAFATVSGSDSPKPDENLQSMGLDPTIYKTGAIKSEATVFTGDIEPMKIVGPVNVTGMHTNVVIGGLIRYKDVFQTESDIPHETRFKYCWSNSLGLVPSMWFQEGGIEENHET